MKIQPLDATGTADGDLIVIEGKQGKGATSKAEISGISPKSTKVAGSDIIYYVSNKGVGDLSVDFGILDLPEDSGDVLLGAKGAGEDGIKFYGNDTEAPYCAITMESSDGHGGTAILGFFKGIFSRDKIELNTLDPQETYKPEADSWTFTPAASDKSDETAGQYFGKYVGTEDENVTKLETLTLGTAPKA